MSWGEDFVAVFERVGNPLAGLRAAASPSPDLSPAELARHYVQIVPPGETTAQVANRLKGALEVASKEVNLIHTALVTVEQAIVAAQLRKPPLTLDEAGGILLSSDFAMKSLAGEIYGPRPLTLGAIGSLPQGHWCRSVLDDDDWFMTPEGPCAFIGEGQIIHIREAVAVTRRLRTIQRDRDAEYRRQQEQSEQRARLQWEQSPDGQIHALRQEIKELKRSNDSLLGRNT
ncbi:MAG: hypothetical protein JWP89_5196 [Schlesneria sp.]|nr:hypothetical protein [Schlesneria sp.]